MRLVPNTDTVPASVNRYLLPHERQVITVHPNAVVIVVPVGAAVAGLVGAVVASFFAFSADALLIIWLAWALVLLYSIGKVFRWFGEYFVATPQRLLLVRGIITTEVICIPNAKAASLRFQRSFMGRLLGYGHFILEADRTQPVWTARFLPYPEQLFLEVTGLIYPDRPESEEPDTDSRPRWPSPGPPFADQREWEWRRSQPDPPGSWRAEQPADEVYPEHDGRGEDEQRGP